MSFQTDSPMSQRLCALYPVYASGQAISYILLELCEHLRSHDLDVELMFPAADASGRRQFTKMAIPMALQRLAYRLDRSERYIRAYTERRFLSRLRPGDVAYPWPSASSNLFRAVRARGHLLLTERINCHLGTAKQILDTAYARLERPPTHGITRAAVDQETQDLLLADYVFAPSPAVAASIIKAGIPAERVLRSSYGWDPARLALEGPKLDECDGVTALFVGRGIVRKGLDLAVSYWSRAQVEGRFAIMGRIDDEMREICGRDLENENIVEVSFRSEVGSIYRSADIFLFPTLEEGSPLVMYEAMASGLACLVSPMAAGDVGRDGVDCIVLDPLDSEAWIESLRRLAADPGLRRQLGESARARASAYTWDKVASARRAQILAACTEGRR